MHVCWGNYEGPHTWDIPLEQILPLLLLAKPATMSIEGSNPRHAHEWSVFERVALPPGKKIIPGVIDSVSNFVEHPELVAERLCRYASIVGRDNIIAGSDCGFGTSAVWTTVEPRVAWAKLSSLVEGTLIANKRLWG
jgi:5-methyltetrahydropteroyltriglutamate--homocysteine methyltransferase